MFFKKTFPPNTGCLIYDYICEISKNKFRHKYAVDNALFRDGQSNRIASVVLVKHCL